ncbi:hypothetical protein GVN20_05015 [Runella sp. CRIBMP]|uniref:hypothetical protein n=1 Tax=Runella sp. CRIBMP TaxID=2683261 RepID=UPI001411E151|nr:hypothetical protein [Runella sp. CRIBMP]NBB18711.1 hypothetical protein [Runella sp. CRIBMP]
MKAKDKRRLLESLFNGTMKPYELAEHEALPTVIISLPDGSLDVGHSKMFSDTCVTQEEFKRVCAKVGSNQTIFILPDNGRSTEV